jgi:hypothetical protein
MVGALGAALLALRRLEKLQQDKRTELRGLSAEKEKPQSSALITQH